MRYDGCQGGAASWRAPAWPACQGLHVDDECDDGTDEVAVMSMSIVWLIMMMLHSPRQLYNIIIVFAAVGIIHIISIIIIGVFIIFNNEGAFKRPMTYDEHPIHPIPSNQPTYNIEDDLLFLREGFTKKSCCSFGFCPNEGGGGLGGGAQLKFFVTFS